MKRFLLILFLIHPLVLRADEGTELVHYATFDTVAVISPDTVISPTEAVTIDSITWKPDAMRSVWLGAIVPGLGQIYNRSYWKVPIVYAGFMGCIYAITTNGERYTSLKGAYRDLYNDATRSQVNDDPGKSYNAVLPEGYDIERMGGINSYLSTLDNWQSTYHRYRDLSIVATVLVYALSLIDAYVDAQLFDFDISDNLSLNVSPQLYYDVMNQRTAEVKLAITF